MGQIQNVGRKILGIARVQVGTKAVDKSVVAIPGRWRFV